MGIRTLFNTCQGQEFGLGGPETKSQSVVTLTPVGGGDSGGREDLPEHGAAAEEDASGTTGQGPVL